MRLRFKGNIPTSLTKSGWLLIVASLLTGTAAYNSANNVLFLALSFLLSSILLNGIISWWNFSKLEFSVHQFRQTRAKEETQLSFTIKNNKRFLPTMGLTTEIIIEQGNENKSISRSIRQTIEARASIVADVNWIPQRRGTCIIRVEKVLSQFPFGFILKTYPVQLKEEVVVWPAKQPYREFFFDNVKSENAPNRETLTPVSGTEDFSGLRDYRNGDPINQFHWKKTASKRKPVVALRNKQGGETPSVLFDFHESHFETPFDFERFCSRIGSWVEEKWNTREPCLIALHGQSSIELKSPQACQKLMDELSLIEAKKERISHSTAKRQRCIIVSPKQMK